MATKCVVVFAVFYLVAVSVSGRDQPAGGREFLRQRSIAGPAAARDWILTEIQLTVERIDETTSGPRVDQAGETSAAAASERNSIGMRFAEIPAGSFNMGSTVREAEQPVHGVSVRRFWMGVTEVTQAQWQTVMGGNPSHFTQAGRDAPVEMVTWEDAQVFIRKLNALEPDRRYRLPSEAEWEYACRAGSKEDPYGPVDDVAWVKENSGGTTHPVGLKRPNAFGLYDMLGNVPEWVQDTWHPDYHGAPADGTAWEGTGSPYHPLRGGGWDLPAFFLHAALRDPYHPIHRLGFRVAYVPLNVVRQPSTKGRVGFEGPSFRPRPHRHLVGRDDRARRECRTRALQRYASTGTNL